MARPITYSQTATGLSNPMLLDTKTNPFNVSIGVSISGTGTYTVQFSMDNPASFATPALYNSAGVWFSHATLASLSANSTGNIAFPVRAVRTNVASVSGTVKTTVIQAGRMG